MDLFEEIKEIICEQLKAKPEEVSWKPLLLTI